MKCYAVPDDGGRHHVHSQALIALAEASPETFGDLFATHAASDVRGGSREWDVWKQAIQVLDLPSRHDLWRRVKDLPIAREVCWVIAGGDTRWLAQAVGDPTFNIPLRALLSAFAIQLGPRYPLETLATALRPLDPEPDDLLHTLEVGTFVGEEHELHAAKLDSLRALAASEDEDIARIGRRGIEIYEPLLEKALAKARRAAVHGIGD